MSAINQDPEGGNETLDKDEDNSSQKADKEDHQSEEAEASDQSPVQREDPDSTSPSGDTDPVASSPAEDENLKKSEPEDRDSTGSPKDSSTHLEDLEQEVRYRDTVLWSVKVLEQSVDELEAQLELLQNEEVEEESEFKLRCEAQLSLNNKLEEQIKWYNQEVMKMRERNKKDTDKWADWRYSVLGNESSYDVDLDAMSEFELAQLVKKLERERNNIYGDLRNKSWLLDNQSKEYYHYKELIKAYTGDLNHINKSLEQIWKQRTKSRSSSSFNGSTPMISPGLMNWSGESGIRPSQRIIDPRKGPIRKTAGVRSLPRLDQTTLDEYDDVESGKKKRTRSVSIARNRTKSLEVKRTGPKKTNQAGHRSADELERDAVESSAATSVEPASELSEDLTVESFT